MGIVKVASRGAAIQGPTGHIDGWVGITAPVPSPPSMSLSADETLTPALIRAARGLLDWTLSDLAAKSLLSVSTVRRAEKMIDRARSSESLSLIRQAFEHEGLKFVQSGFERGVMHTAGKS